MKELEAFLERVRQGGPVRFRETLAVIEKFYHYTPTAFANGLGEARFVNEAGQNEGSCKIFAFARLQGLSKEETLRLFGEHYEHVLKTPEGTDHRNIRTFMRFGWQGIEFFGDPLRQRD